MYNIPNESLLSGVLYMYIRAAAGIKNTFRCNRFVRKNADTSLDFTKSTC